MVEDILTTLTNAMSGDYGPALVASLFWGMASVVLSPCHLASIPLVVGYIVQQGPVGARRSVMLSMVFAAGVLITIGIMGGITAGLGRMLGDVGMLGNIVVAIVFLVVGLYLLDILRFSWSPVTLRPTGGNRWSGALILGLVFGAGLGPCTFAFLAPVLAVAFSISSNGVLSALLLVAAFGVGHCAVMAAAGSLAHGVQKYLTWTGRSGSVLWVKRGAGMLVLLGGVYFIITAF
jgi:cytochrome c-type biogenesis protein